MEPINNKALSPILIQEYSKDFELLVMEIKVGYKGIRIISGYGPQKTWPDRMPFFLAMKQEVIKADMGEGPS